MAVHALSSNFRSFFGRINPSPSWVSRASSEYNTVKGLIENPTGLAAELSPTCFLQGSYDRETAIYAINDIDIVALCCLWHPPSVIGGGGRSWSRDEIFDTIAAPLLADGRNRDKVRYGTSSMCVKLDLGIRVEILPVVYKADIYDSAFEPFRLFRPEKQRWEDGFARYHQSALTQKNEATGGNFIRAIKVLKHLRSVFELDAVSFHIECLLYSLPNSVYAGGPASYIPKFLSFLAGGSADEWYAQVLRPPCETERDIFTSQEWSEEGWRLFHRAVVVWAKLATLAANSHDRDKAIDLWKELLDDSFFPRQVTT